MQVDSRAYLGALRAVLDRVADTQWEAVERAADLMVKSIREDGVVHAFGTGHSESFAMEVAGRAGGLVPTNKIALRDIVIFGGEPASVLSMTSSSGNRTSHTASTTLPNHTLLTCLYWRPTLE